MPRLDNPQVPTAVERLLRARPTQGEQFELSSNVSLVLDLLALLGAGVTYLSDAVNLQVVAAGVFAAQLTVPTDQVWLLRGLQKGATTAATAVAVRPSNQTAYWPFTPLDTANTAVTLAAPTFMFPGDQVGILGTGDAGDAARSFRAWYTRFPAP